jgi:hypothetical protein
MLESKSSALPLGDSPSLLGDEIIYKNFLKIKSFYTTF